MVTDIGKIDVPVFRQVRHFIATAESEGFRRPAAGLQRLRNQPSPPSIKASKPDLGRKLFDRPFHMA